MTDLDNGGMSPERTGAVRHVRLGAQVLGTLVIAFGVFADLLRGGGSPGIGMMQWALILAGAALIAAGRFDRHSVGRIRAWVRDDTHAMRLATIVLFAVMVGFTGGLAETVVIAFDRFVVNGFVRVGVNVVWMVPLANALILAAVGLLLWLAARILPQIATPSAVGFVFVLIAADAVLARVRVHGWIAPEAKLVLLVAFAWTVGRAAASRWAAAGPRRGRVVTAFTTVIALLGGAAALQPWWKERAASGALPDAPDGRVNIVLIILDTVRAASLSLYGYDRPTTPELDRFAEAGVVFDRAIAPSSWTLPSHGTMFTGRHPSELHVDWLTPLDRTFPTLAEVLSEAGFATAGFSANTGYVSIESGLARGFARFEDFVPTPGEMVRTSAMLARVLAPLGLEEVVNDDDRGRRTAEDINGAFLAWLDRRRDDRPFFAFLNYFDAHAPFYAPAPFDTLFGGTRPLKRPGPPNFDEQEVAAWRDAYDRSLVYIDTQLGSLFRELERTGVLRNTVVIVSSDHGEHLGENSYIGHATTLYRPVIEVPLVFRGPGIPAGTRVDARVGLRDLATSLLELAGVDARGRIPGRSLATKWQSATPDEPVFSELGRGIRIPQHYPNAQHALWSIYEHDLHFIASESGQEELYRISTDPGEEDNLIASDSLPVDADVLRERLRRHLDSTGQADALAPTAQARAHQRGGRDQ